MTLKPSVNWLLAFVPVAVALDRAGAAQPLVFFCAALAIVPAAELVVHATEQIAARTGDAIGGVLNATFGNAPELIIAVMALRAGLLDMVRASIIGAVLTNLLLALGASLFVGGLRNKDQTFSADAARVYGAMMLLAVISMIVPSVFGRVASAPEYVAQVRSLNVWLALLLLATYALYLFFQLGTHPHLFRAAGGAGAGEEEHGPRWGMPRAIGSLIGASLLAAFMSEILVGAAEGTGEALGMSQAFIGLVIVPAVGGASSFSAVVAARKNKLDLTIGVVFGTCIQIALFVAPALVLASRLVAAQPLDLDFRGSGLGALLMGVVIGVVVIGDGKGNWFKGMQLLVVYAIIAMMFYFLPELAT